MRYGFLVKFLLILLICLDKVDCSLYSMIGAVKNSFFGKEDSESDSENEESSEENLNLGAKIKNTLKNEIKNLILERYKKKMIDSFKNLISDNILQGINPKKNEQHNKISWKNWIHNKIKKVFDVKTEEKKKIKKFVKKKQEEKKMKKDRYNLHDKFEEVIKRNTNSIKNKLFNNSLVNNFKRK